MARGKDFKHRKIKLRIRSQGYGNRSALNSLGLTEAARRKGVVTWGDLSKGGPKESERGRR